MNHRHLMLIGIILLAFCRSARAENWPQWRGPFLNGSTTQTGLPESWDATRNVRWVAPMPGPGAATPIVWGDRVFVTAQESQTKDLLALCVDASTGKVVWQKPLDQDRRTSGRHTMAVPSAVTDGKTVTFYFGTGLLAAFDYAGKQLWARNLQQDYGAFVVKWVYGCSPLLYRGKLYILVMQNSDPNCYWQKSDRKGPLESFLLALDAATGKTLWRHVRPTDAEDESTEAYMTPMPYEASGRREIILVGGECVTGHDADTGAELWRWWFTPPDRQIWQRVVSSPVAGDGLIYAARAQHRGFFAIKGGGKGVLANEWVAWSNEPLSPDVITPLLYQGRLYVMHDDARVMACLDPRTGRVIWEQKLPGAGPFRASPTGADGRIYCVSEQGEALVLAAGDTFQELGRVRIGEPPCQASIAAAAGSLFIRTAKNLYCIGK